MQHPRPARRQHVTIAGNIGVGKSTLVGILAEEFGWQPYYELVADHPYLDDYYADRERWGFHSQIWFLSQRYEQHLEIADTPLSVSISSSPLPAMNSRLRSMMQSTSA